MKICLKSFIAGITVATLGVTTVFATSGIKSVAYNQNKVIFDGKTLDLSKQPMISLIKENDNKVIKQEIFKSEELSDEYMNKISGVSYKPGKSLPVSELRLLTLTYIDYNGETQYGNLIVNEKVSQEVIDIFTELYEAKFPIEKMRLVDEYNADDELSMKDNNTSAYNHRLIAGTNTLSYHAKGLAIDINPLYNPYVSGDYISPKEGTDYAARTLSPVPKGMIFDGDACYNAFTKRGWSWGGDWKTPKDYQHFEKTEGKTEGKTE